MATRPPSSPSSRNRSATLAPGWAPRVSPFTDMVIAVSKDLPCRGNFRLGRQLKVQARLSLALAGFDDQRAFRSGQPRHVKGKLGFAIQPRRRRIARRLGRALDAGGDAGTGNRRSIFFA